MQVKFSSFPVVHFYTTCKKHNCEVEIRTEEAKPFNKQQAVGGQITSLKCKLGGPVSAMDCMDDWEITILSPGPILVTP